MIVRSPRPRIWMVPAVLMTLLFLDMPAAQAAAPMITSFNPTSGPVGTSVQINGAGFQEGSVVSAVTFNGTAATFTVNSDELITATLPSGATDGTVQVTDSEGTATSETTFTVTPSFVPIITSFTPTSGPVGLLPPPPSGGAFRVFSDTSEWNKPLPVDAPIASNSDAIIAEINTYENGVYPRLSTGAWSEPIYFTTPSDAVGNVNCLPIQVRVPANLQGASTTDAQATVFDQVTGVVYKVRSFTVDKTTTPWTVTATGGCSIYDMASNGLHYSLPESDRDASMNFGHRGYPPAIHGVRYDEVASGSIDHVIKVAMDKTAACHVYPGSGHESGKGGVLTCEGLILRIKPEIDLQARGLTGGALVIATAMQEYGVVIGDTGGVAMGIKLENLTVEGRPESWADLGIASAHMFQGELTFDDFVVIQPAYHRP
jgi:IPT/TIG domain